MSSVPAIPFVDLKRRFQAWRFERKGDEPEVETDAITGFPRTWDWDTLLKRRRVVVLAEPGSGKTREMQEVVKRLRNAKERAYFIRLDRLVNASLAEALGPTMAEEFDGALRERREVSCFLDSVDEAKLTRPTDFFLALSRFAVALGPTGRSHARIFLSSRVSEWRHETDYDEVTGLLCEPLQEQMVATAEGEATLAKSDRLLIVKLALLAPEQVGVFARAIGTHDPERFLAAIGDAFAWEFAQRPLDVIDLAKFWNERKRLGTLTELVQAHVRRNLIETPERARDTGSPLTEADALTGAMSLAAATILCNRSAFAIPPRVDGLDAAECLPAGWSPTQINALLGRPLFDDASFGKRQFHHRRASEFLAATWIEARMEHGCVLRTLKDIFFEASPSGLDLRPSLDASAAWLCGLSRDWARDFRAWVLASRPEIHLSFGDPEALSIDYRRDVLHAIATRYADRRRARIEADHTTLVRFATPDLASEISRLFLDATTALQLRWHLLHVAAVRKLAGCVDAALIVVAIEGVDEQLRTEAVELLISVGDQTALLRLADIARATPTLGESLGMAFVRALHPAILSTADLVELATRVREPDLPIFPALLSRHFEEHCPPAQPGELLHAFLGLIQCEPQIPRGRGRMALSQQFGRLCPVLLPLAKAVLIRDAPPIGEVDDVVLALLLIGERVHDFEQDRINALTAATERHSMVRRAFFLRCIELAVGEDGQEPTHFHFFPFGNHALLRLERRDLTWLVPDVATEQNPARRLTLFRMALQVWLKTGRHHAEKRTILAAIQDAPALREEFRTTMASVRRAPFHWWWETQIRARFGESYWWQHQWRGFRQWIERWRVRVHLNCHLWRLASGVDPGTLCWLAGQGDKENRSRWTTTNWNGVSRRYGPLVKWAARRGCKHAWRRHNPGPPSAKPEANRTSPEVIAGLNGIQAEWSDGQLDFRALSEADARSATFYAVNELNAPADWLNELAVAQPRAVGDALMACIEDEWNMRPDPVRVYGVLAKILSQADALADLVQGGVLRLMAAGDPTQPQILDFALRLLASRRTAGLVAVAQERARAAPAGSASAILWAAAWLRIDAASAIPWLESLPATDVPTDRLMVGVCSALHGGDMFRPVRDPEAPYLKPPVVVSFIRLVYRHVRRADDLVHHGTYSPNARDHAQEFRDGLVPALADQTDEAMPSRLAAMADDPAFAALRDYILDRRDAALRTRSLAAPWRASSIREFTTADEVDPQSDRDLNHITLKRLDDIKHAVELSDYSIRNALRPTDDEYALRHFVATELQRRANGRYQPPQEAEIDEERRPDIRVVHSAVTGPISIEIKWAENWTVVQLLHALETQLVGTYLRPHESHFGVFLLGMIAREGKRRWDNPAGGPRLNFQQVVAIIRTRAVEICATTAGVHGVSVVGVDFRSPSHWAD